MKSTLANPGSKYPFVPRSARRFTAYFADSFSLKESVPAWYPWINSGPVTLHGEKERYLKRYGVDLEDENNYDLIIDTSFSSPSDIAEVILECENYYEKNQEFGKKWTSPEELIPLQGERDTWGRGESGYDFEEIAESVKKKGYLPNQVIEVINVDNLNYIIEGHHRNFAAAYAGKTLVPYSVLAKNDEEIPNYRNTARERANSITLSYLYGHEWMLQKLNKSFSYGQKFPELCKNLKCKEGIEH